MDAIISAAETGFTGSLVGSNIPSAYMGTITGSVPLPRNQLTMFLVSIPREHSRVLLPKALWTSCNCQRGEKIEIKKRREGRKNKKERKERDKKRDR
uniref:Uncharacterized protein n=1 Tax=Pygocentrus nattereri TaxID=42514 RepID=A0AAR2M103_PYGNA